ncbi:MAG: hypothetical protein JSV24_04405 [Bacteroidales bacterium]|nr:MAG: hypothetical protein JSV24_04405 [Bacteroidales bacterium]
MTEKKSGRLVILAGPSCVGKSPLDKALKRIYPDLRNRMHLVVLYNSRNIRPGEEDGVDYYFRKREFIETLTSNDRYVVMDVRGDLQALDLKEVSDKLETGDLFFEGNPFIGRTLLTHPSLKEVKKRSAFMAPLSRDEILFLKAPERHVTLPDMITDIMRRKLLRRTRRQKPELSLEDLENIERRASSAYRELKEAHIFENIIPNHDGEDSENWDAFYYPIGDAGKALNAFVSLLKGKKNSWIERWEPDLLP